MPTPLPKPGVSAILFAMQSSRPHNRQLFLETLRRAGTLSRTDLARVTGLTNQTITNLAGVLLEEGLIYETGRRTPTRGQPPRDLALRPEGALAAGFHLDRRRWSWTVTDLTGAVLAQTGADFAPGAGPDELVPLWTRAWASLRAGFALGAPFCGVGAAGPGPQDRGVLVHPPDFPGWDGVDLRSRLASITDLDVRLENDARAAAVGELWGGHGRSRTEFLYLYCSWGFGLGLVLDGRLRTGQGGRAGEVQDLVTWPGEGLENPSAAIVAVVGPLVRGLDVGTLVVGGSWPSGRRQELATALAAHWPDIEVLVSGLDDAAAVGAAALALTRRFEAP